MADLHTSRNRAAQADLPREEIYREWLGITNPAPSYYGLLGVPELETDATAILHAGRHVKRKLRAYQIGLYRKQALELLAEVGQAVSVLTNPEKKKAYNRELMGRWRGIVEELYRAHFQADPRDPAAVEAWLSACVVRGVPVTRLMPPLMRSLHGRVRTWPPTGELRLSLPLNLWLYRDAVALGQCLHVGALENRAEAVKRVQKVLGISEGLARLVAEEIGRGLHLFSKDRVVVQAKKDPDGMLRRLARRIRRHGGESGKDGKVLAAVADLVGIRKENLDRLLEHIDAPPVEVSRHAASAAARRARQQAGGVWQQVCRAPDRLVEWIADRPQVLAGLAIAAGIMALVVGILVVAGITNSGGAGPAPAVSSASGEGAGSPGTTPPLPAEQLLPPLPRIEDAPPDWLKDFRKRYPAGETAVAKPGEVSPTKEPGAGKTTSEVKFFGVDGTTTGKRPPDNGSKAP